MDIQWDVIIVGGSVAGLSAGLMLTRAGRRVIIVDDGAPRNRFTSHMHGVLGHEGVVPGELVAQGRQDLESFGGVVRNGRAAGAEIIESGVAITLTDGAVLRGRRLLVATGLTDDLPDIEGLAEQWGQGVYSCPYCDGYEARDGRIGILAAGNHSPFQAQLLRQWSPNVTYFVDRTERLDHLASEAFAALGIVVEAVPVVRIVSGLDGIAAVELEDGRRVEIDTIFTAPRLSPHDALLQALGADLADTPFGRFVATDGSGRTSIAGVWAAGNVADPIANVPVSMGAGSIAGAAINADLVMEDVAAAITASAAT